MKPGDYLAYEVERGNEVLKLEWDQLVRGEVVARKFTALFRYDAPNAYGMLIRELAVCEYVTRYGDKSDVNEYLVRLNGYTRMEYLSKQIDLTK